MQQEDDLRALAKIMDFLRAVSIVLIVVHAMLFLGVHKAVPLSQRAFSFSGVMYSELLLLVLCRNNAIIPISY